MEREEINATIRLLTRYANEERAYNKVIDDKAKLSFWDGYMMALEDIRKDLEKQQQEIPKV